MGGGLADSSRRPGDQGPFGARPTIDPTLTGIVNNRCCRKFLPYVMLIVLGIVCYANSFRNDFVWDDNFQIVQNRMLRSWAFVPRFFSTDMAEAYEPSATSFPIYR